MSEHILQCKRCGYRWIKRVSRPKKCPNCFSPYYMFEPDSIEDLKRQFSQLPEIQKSELLQVLTGIKSSSGNEGGGEYNDNEEDP